jgi:hypothetical protein
MKPAMTIQTPIGYEFYNNVFSDYNISKITDQLNQFRQRVFSAREEIEHDILTLLEDPVMIRKYKMDDDDIVGWALYRELSDKFSVLNHFYTRK